MARSLARKLEEDPRIAEAKRTLLAAVEERQKEIKGIRPPVADLQQEYAAALKELGEIRGGSLFFPYIGSGFGKGPFVELGDGSIKYDLICGIGVHYFGHNHPILLEAALDAALSNSIMQGNLQQNGDTLQLSRKLLELSGMQHCILTTSGVMANENALKMAFQKRSPATRILAFSNCFMGRTLSCAQITDKPNFRKGLPLNLGVDYIPFFDEKRPEKSIEMAVRVLQRKILRYPGQHAAICFELVQGEAGAKTAPREFFTALMDICKEEGIPILIDEVQTYGRTRELFAFHDLQLQEYPDLVTVGKLCQVCATLFNENMNPSPGLISQTFTGSTSSIRASLALIKELTSGAYYGPKGRIANIERAFHEGLAQLPVEGPFGRGAMVAFTPYGGDPAKVKQFIQRLFTAGVLAFTAGSNPAHARFLPPAPILEESHIEEVLQIVAEALHE